MSGARRAIVLVILAAIPAVITAQLNPTVKVLPRAKTAVPAECEQGLAVQPALRLSPEERTSVRDTSRDMAAPPSRSLRSELQAAFDAARHNSRDAFRDSLAQAKSMLTSYPPGGEKTAAANLVDVLDDVDKIWNYQFTSPTGAFFDTSSEPYRIASKYPGYESAIRRQIVTDQNGVKFYPTHETRDFLLAESAQRLSHLTGKPVPPPVTSTRGTTTVKPPAPHVTPERAVRTSEKPPKPKPHHTTKQTTTTQTTKQPATHVKRPSQHRESRPPVRQEARATTTPTPRVSKPAPMPTPKPSVASTPATTTHAVTTATATALPTPPPMPPPATSSATTSSDTAMTPPPSTTSAPSSTETTATTAPTESNATAKPAQSRSLFGPILLIIVGIGLLLTLWRASS